MTLSVVQAAAISAHEQHEDEPLVLGFFGLLVPWVGPVDEEGVGCELQSQIRNRCGFHARAGDLHVELGGALGQSAMLAEPRKPLAVLQKRLGFDERVTGGDRMLGGGLRSLLHIGMGTPDLGSEDGESVAAHRPPSSLSASMSREPLIWRLISRTRSCASGSGARASIKISTRSSTRWARACRRSTC
jgi:hypothetical protein